MLDSHLQWNIGCGDGMVNNRWVLDHGISRYAENGEFVGYIGSCIDVTDRRKAEDMVKAMALLPVQNPSPVLRIDGEGILLYKNPAADHSLQDSALTVEARCRHI